MDTSKCLIALQTTQLVLLPCGRQRLIAARRVGLVLSQVLAQMIPFFYTATSHMSGPSGEVGSLGSSFGVIPLFGRSTDGATNFTKPFTFFTLCIDFSRVEGELLRKLQLAVIGSFLFPSLGASNLDPASNPTPFVEVRHF